MADKPSAFFEGLREVLRVRFGINFDESVQSIQAVKDDAFPWGMLRFESSAQMSVRVTNSTTTFDFPVGIEFAVLYGPDTYRNAVLDFAAEIAAWLNGYDARAALDAACGPCLESVSASSFQIMSLPNARSGGAGLINCNFRLRFARECKF